jgi:hypothetical protein
MRTPHVLFHGNCFDGVVSAAYLVAFLRAHEGCDGPALEPVGYERRNLWLERDLEPFSYVVDFLFHPRAEGWWDHHQTTFLDKPTRQSYETARRSLWIWDPKAPSCAELLSRHLQQSFGFVAPTLHDAVRWATMTDTATYETPAQAVLAEEPALTIATTLSGSSADFNRHIVMSLLESPLTAIAKQSDVAARYGRYRELEKRGRARLARVAHVENGVVIFGIDTRSGIVNRYAPFLLFPDALFSVGLMRNEKGLSLLTMRNPWKDVPHPHLGRICARFGGGGHERVGAIVFSPHDRGTVRAAVAALREALEHPVTHGSKVQSI